MPEVSDYLKWLRGQVGVEERPRGSNRQPYAAMAGHLNGFAWCASFVTAGANQIGLRLPDGANTASCYANEIAFKRAGRLSTTPRVGDIFFVYFPSLSRVAHTGVVWKVAGGWVHTIEGNTNTDGSREGYKVAMRVRPAHRATGAVGIRSYGRPYYGEDAPMNDKDRDWLEATIKRLVPTADEVARAMMGHLVHDEVVENTPTVAGAPKGSNWSLVGAAAAGDLKADRTLEHVNTIQNVVLATQRDVAAIKAAVVKPAQPGAAAKQ